MASAGANAAASAGFVDQGFATWLKSAALKMTITPEHGARWRSQGATIEVATPFATLAGAQAEAARVAAFFSGPIVRDVAVVSGRRRGWIGRCVQLDHPRLGYAGGVPVFVVAVAEQDNGTSILTVLRRLA